jgi:hypothetical protein
MSSTFPAGGVGVGVGLEVKGGRGVDVAEGGAAVAVAGGLAVDVSVGMDVGEFVAVGIAVGEVMATALGFITATVAGSAGGAVAPQPANARQASITAAGIKKKTRNCLTDITLRPLFRTSITHLAAGCSTLSQRSTNGTRLAKIHAQFTKVWYNQQA